MKAFHGEVMRLTKSEVIQIMKKIVPAILVIFAVFYFVKAQFTKEKSVFENPSSPAPQSYPALEQIEQERIKLVESVSPGVATIFTVQEITVPNPFADIPFDIPFGDFFGIPNDKQFKQRIQGLGSGFIVKVDREKKLVYLLTNNHVVENAKNIQVRFKNKMVLDAKIIGTDKLSDVAVIAVPFKKGIENFAEKNILRLGDSDKLKVGSTVIAIGSPLGLTNTVTMGIVSALNRQIEDRPGEGFIQTDAAINPGNSGGPLINIRGEVIGINTAIIQGAQGLGFAVPINQAKWVMEQILTYGKVKRSKIGVIIQPLTADLAEHFGVTEGALVAQVQPGSPADKAGIRPGDVIVAVNGKKISDITDLQNNVMRNPPGTVLRITIIRDGKKIDLDVKTVSFDETQPEEEGEKPTDIETDIGLIVRDLTPDLMQKFRLPNVQGVFVYGVKSGSLADEAGLETGDIILSVNRIPVKSTNEFWNIIKSEIKKGSDSVLLYIQRGDAKIFITMPLK